MVDPKFLHYTYYHCSKSKRPLCIQKSVTGREIERQINDFIARISISVKFKDWAIRYLHEIHSQDAKSQADIMKSQEQAYNSCLGQIEGLVTLKTSPDNKDGSLLSDMEYARRRNQLMKQKLVLEESLKNIGQRLEESLRLAEQTFEFACTVQERFAKGDAKVKKAILHAIGSNLTLKDKKLLIEARKPFLILGNELVPDDPVFSPIEPKNTLIPQRQKIPSVFMSLQMRGGRDDVRTFRREDKKLVKAIYHFFRSVVKSPEFSLADWWSLYYYGNINPSRN